MGDAPLRVPRESHIFYYCYGVVVVAIVFVLWYVCFDPLTQDSILPRVSNLFVTAAVGVVVAIVLWYVSIR